MVHRLMLDESGKPSATRLFVAFILLSGLLLTVLCLLFRAYLYASVLWSCSALSAAIVLVWVQIRSARVAVASLGLRIHEPLRLDSVEYAAPYVQTTEHASVQPATVELQQEPDWDLPLTKQGVRDFSEKSQEKTSSDEAEIVMGD